MAPAIRSGSRSDEIPIQTRMITLADMFDALTASDRPYKPAVTAEKALEIIRAEADAGLLDRDLVDIMTESQVYKKVLGTGEAASCGQSGRASPPASS